MKEDRRNMIRQIKTCIESCILTVVLRRSKIVVVVVVDWKVEGYAGNWVCSGADAPRSFDKEGEWSQLAKRLAR